MVLIPIRDFLKEDSKNGSITNRMGTLLLTNTKHYRAKNITMT
jgi:hypothetical protein